MPLLHEDNNDQDWVFVKENRSIERGWRKSLFFGVGIDKENDVEGENGRSRLERVDRVLTKFGYAKSSGEAKKMVANGSVTMDGETVARGDQKVDRERLVIDGEAFQARK